MIFGYSRRRILSLGARGRRPRAATSRSDYLIPQPLYLGSLLCHISKPGALCRSPALRRRYCNSQPIHHRPRWYHNTLKISCAAILVSGVTGLTALAYYLSYLDLEVVSYTNRTHVVVLSPQSERELWDPQFNKEVKKYVYAPKSRIVDRLHPDNVRVRRILEKLNRAAHKDVEDLDDGTRRKQQGKKPSRLQPQAGHLHGVKWEFILVEDDQVSAGCIPGKIMVTTGLLELLGTDAEIAFALGHEVGHTIARHKADIAKQAWFPTLLRRPFFSMMEIEADHIGIMLVGAAGFNPNASLVVLWKLAKINALTKEEALLSPYPSHLKRSKYLSRDKVMQKAMELYKKATPDQGNDKQAGDSGAPSFRESLRNQCNFVSRRLIRAFGGRSKN